MPRTFDDTALIAHLAALAGPSSSSSPRQALISRVLPALVRCIDTISDELRAASHVGTVGSANAFGDEQLNVDVLAERAVRAAVRDCPAIVTASSEEDPVERASTQATLQSTTDDNDSAREEKYTIAFDPLDGSSIIAPNWSVGTIVGVWEGASALGGSPAERQVAAVLGVYGPRTTVMVALRVPGMAAGVASGTCFEVGLVRKGKGEGGEGTTVCEIVRPRITMAAPPFRTRYFAPANLRAAAEDERYARLVQHFIASRYTLRYSGGLVPDVVHALVKGHGIYVSPVTERSAAKLRRLYELAPIALVMECAGAEAVDPVTGEDVLARPIADCDERAGLVCGTREEVRVVREMMGLGG